jgi:hypothetical protein
MTQMSQNDLEAMEQRFPDWRSMRPITRMQLARQFSQGIAPPDPAKLERIRAESELQRVEERLARHIASRPPRFANGITQHEKTTAFLQDRAAGIRRRLATAS